MNGQYLSQIKSDIHEVFGTKYSCWHPNMIKKTKKTKKQANKQTHKQSHKQIILLIDNISAKLSQIFTKTVRKLPVNILR